MKFYLSSFLDREPYYDLKRNKLMQDYLREIKKEVGFKVTFEKDSFYEGYQHIVIDIPSKKAIVQLKKAVGEVVVHEQEFAGEDHKYPKISIYGDCLKRYGQRDYFTFYNTKK